MKTRIALAAAFAAALASQSQNNIAHGGQQYRAPAVQSDRALALQSDRALALQINATQKRRVAVRARLCGTNQFQQVVTWTTVLPRPQAHLAIEQPPRRLLWEAPSTQGATTIDSIQVSDLDRDGVPEILSVWRQAGSSSGVL